jgi:glycosyltransferase involved in cell wall biosynthesis
MFIVTNSIKSAPSISIIIRSKNEEHLIGQTLFSVFKQEIDMSFEVIVIDSGSTDRTLDIVRSYAASLYEIDGLEFSYGRALNYGAALAKGQYLINLSAHCIPTDSTWMRRLVSPLRSKSNIVATHGRQLPIKGMNPFEERTLLAIFTPDKNGQIRPPFSNANCAIRQNALEAYPFDEKASFAEDYIWAKLLPKELEIEYVHEAAVYHSHPLKLRYWAKRSYDNALFIQYLRHVYGLEYRWGANVIDPKPSRSSWRKMLDMVNRLIVRQFNIVVFLFKHNYLKFLPVLPFYLIIEQCYHLRGKTDGLKRYGRG